MDHYLVRRLRVAREAPEARPHVARTPITQYNLRPSAMRIPAPKTTSSPAPALGWKPRVAYSTNVHRGETLSDVYAFLRDYTIPINRLVFGNKPSGVELRLGMGSAGELVDARERENFRAFLDENKLVVFSINAFPLLDFHSKRVKEQVYLPSWAEPARGRWTKVIADIFADVLPEGVQGSISTSAGCFRRFAHDPKTSQIMAQHYLETVNHLARIEERTGKTILLAIEPEPDTTLETAREVVAFFEWHLLPTARSEASKQQLSPSQAEARLRRLLTVNFDTCHFSVLFQDPVESLRQLWRAGIEIGKVHVTNAPVLKDPHRDAAGYKQLRAMQEPRYFHQFCGQDAGGSAVWRGLDLNELPRQLSSKTHPTVTEIRAHYHVPVHLTRLQSLTTTRPETKRAVQEILRTGRSSHLVIETYTWPLLEKKGNLVKGIEMEFAWLRRVLGKHWV